MNYKIRYSDGPALIGDLEFKKKYIEIPNILFIETDRIKAPDFADLKITKKTNFDNIEILNYSSQLFNKTNNFIDKIVELKKEKKVVYTPSIAEANNLALLSYIGVNIFDSLDAIKSARNKIMYFLSGNKNINQITLNPCNCPVCSNLKKEPKDMTFKQILNHNYFVLDYELKNIKNHIVNKDLRSLVEKRIISNPNFTGILRFLDQNYYDFLEEKTPVSSENIILSTTIESLKRPEILRFQNRVINSFIKPKSAKVLLLLPCSAKKPYSFSKSHSYFKKVLSSSRNSNIIHELIITSPIGLVPRELELVYPASNYDIPVTGVWLDEEKEMIKKLILAYIKNNQYDVVISHLKKDMNIFINDILKIDFSTCVDHPTSDESVEKLKITLDKVTNNYKKIDYKDRIKEDLLSFASYQFDKKIAQKLIAKAKIKGKYPYYKIFKDNKQFGMLVKEKGMISLTLDGAKLLFENNKYIVKISDDFELKGSVFAPGVIDASKEIRIGDEVVIVRNNRIIANGTALMNGSDMKDYNFGEAVKVRHISKV